MEPNKDTELLTDWARELGCTEDELRSAMGEAGRSMFEPLIEQFELDFAAPG